MIKHRCVESDFFEASKVRQGYVDLFLSKGLSRAQVDLFLRSHRGYLFISDDVKASIERNIAWAFDRGFFVPQRYNTELFGTYYTGKEIETVEREYEFHYRKSKRTGAVKFTVFSLNVSARISDLRPISELRVELIDSVDYSTCQFLAQELKNHCDGLAVPSARNSRGNCCPIFERSTLVAGEWVKEGELFPS